jgi:hypothetical protein
MIIMGINFMIARNLARNLLRMDMWMKEIGGIKVIL